MLPRQGVSTFGETRSPGQRGRKGVQVVRDVSLPQPPSPHPKSLSVSPPRGLSASQLAHLLSLAPYLLRGRTGMTGQGGAGEAPQAWSASP